MSLIRGLGDLCVVNNLMALSVCDDFCPPLVVDTFGSLIFQPCQRQLSLAASAPGVAPVSLPTYVPALFLELTKKLPTQFVPPLILYYSHTVLSDSLISLSVYIAPPLPPWRKHSWMCSTLSRIAWPASQLHLSSRSTIAASACCDC